MRKTTSYVLIPSAFLKVLVAGSLFLKGEPPVKATQAPGESRISVNEGRPAAGALDVLEPLLGVSISYEDPPWLYSGDIVRAVDTPEGAEYLKTHPDFRAIIPKSSSLQLTFPLEQASGRIAASPNSVLQDVVDEHSRRSNPGKFRVQELADHYGFVLVPVTNRDAMGRTVEVRSPLDVPVFFEEAERDGAQTLEELFKAVAQASGYRVVVAQVPILEHGNTKVRVGARGEVARDVLVKMLQTFQWANPKNVGVIPQMSWRLFYDPGLKYFMFNIKPVQRQQVGATGMIRRVNVPRKTD